MAKKIGFTLLIIITVFSFVNAVSVKSVFAAAPVVSIGVGNGNLPANIGPVHGSVYSGLIPVYATMTDADNDLENYHFRVIKDGGAQGHTCDDLFAPENQGYASTTLGKTTCGFNFNQSVYMDAAGFTNTVIATLNSADIIAFGGEGDYWLVLGAVDFAGNRVNSNYLNDPKIRITISSTTPTTSATTLATTTSSDNSNLPDPQPTTPVTTVVSHHGGSFVSINQSVPTTPTVPVLTTNGEFVLATAQHSSGKVETKPQTASVIPIVEATSSESTSTNLAAVADPVTPNQPLLASLGSLSLGIVRNNWFWLFVLLAILAVTLYYPVRSKLS